MRIVFLTIICCLITLGLSAQDSLYKKKLLTNIDIEAFYSYYAQDGNHSAVTGGIGTEELTVNNVGFNLDVTFDTSHTLIVASYLDVITSASVDNIDYVVSSASAQDNHLAVQLGYQYTSKRKPFLLGAKYLFSIESDLTSHGFSLWTSVGSADLSRNFSVSINCFFDDLRWGRFNEKVGYKPTTLVYPVELRYKQWFDIYTRNSYNLNLGLRQDLNRKMSLQVDLGSILQKGLISTSFHRMYYKDSDSVKVENLPRQRLQFPMGVGLNSFIGSAFILKAYYRYYWDDIGIRAHTLSIETPIKLNYKFSFYPFVRIHQQSASTYFKPYKEHALADEFYTSDYDLSAFWSYKVGLGFGFYPDQRFGRSRWSFNNLMLRYAYYWRTDNLNAHMISLLLNVRKD